MTQTQIDLINGALQTLPRDFRSEGDAHEWLMAFATSIGAAYDQVTQYVADARTRSAVGSKLDLLADERGTTRRNGESDEVLGARLRTPSDAVTPFALVGNNQLLIDASPGTDTYTYSLYWLSASGTYQLVTSVTVENVTVDGFDPALLYINESPSRGDGQYVWYRSDNGVNQGVITPSPNPGYYEDNGDPGDGSNLPELAEEPRQEGIATIVLRAAGVTIPVGYPALLEIPEQEAFCKESFSFAFADRGYRVGQVGPGLILMLPYGTDEATRKAVDEAVRQYKAAGVSVTVERRLNP